MQEGEASKQLSLFGICDKNAQCEQPLETVFGRRQETESHCDQGSQDMHLVNKEVIEDGPEDEAMRLANLGHFHLDALLNGTTLEEKERDCDGDDGKT